MKMLVLSKADKRAGAFSAACRASATAFSETFLQTCIVHLIRNSLKFAGMKDCKRRGGKAEDDLSDGECQSGAAGVRGFRDIRTVPEAPRNWKHIRV